MPHHMVQHYKQRIQKMQRGRYTYRDIAVGRIQHKAAAKIEAAQQRAGADLLCGRPVPR